MTRAPCLLDACSTSARRLLDACSASARRRLGVGWHGEADPARRRLSALSEAPGGRPGPAVKAIGHAQQIPAGR